MSADNQQGSPSDPSTTTRRAPENRDEDIVLPISNNRYKTMSARLIPGVEKLPRVWLFAI